MTAEKRSADKNLERLEYILDGAGLGSWDWWLATNEVTFDRHWCEMLGLRPDDTPQVLSTWDLRVHPDDKEQAYKDIQSYLNGETEVYENIHRMRHADGHWVWILDRGRISERGPDGRPIRFTGTHLDVTKYREIEVLSENIQRIAAIGGWKVQKRGSLLLTAETVRIIGLSRTKVTWSEFSKVFKHEDVERAQRIFDLDSARQTTHELFELVDFQGNKKWVAVSAELVLNAVGKAVELRGSLQDITASHKQSIELCERIEREQAYIAEIERTRSRLEKLVETVPAGIFATDTAGDITFVNKTWTKLTGVSPENASNCNWFNAVHPEDLEKVRDKWHDFIEDKGPFDLVYRFGRADRGETIVHGRAAKIIGPSGPSEGYLGSLQDITELEKVRADLEKTARNLDRFFSASIDLLCIADMQGWFLRVNPAWTKILGYSQEELLSKPFLEFVHPDDRENTIAEVGKLKTGTATISFENRYRTKEGSYRVLSWVSAPEPETGLLYSVAHDVTIARQREMELEQAQRVARIGSWSYDAETHQIKWSPQMYKMFPEDPAQGPPSFDRHRSTIHKDDVEYWGATVAKCLQDEVPYTIRFRSIFPDGSIIWVKADGEPVLGGGKIVGLRGTCQDITDLVMAEDQAKIERSKAMLNAKLASLGEMSAGIAHEINNPLMIITGMAWALPKYTGHPQKLKEKVALIESAAGRIARIVGGLKKFSRHPMPRCIEAHNLINIIEDALIIVGTKVRNADVSLIKDFGSKTMIRCDEIEIEQVIVNLINNATDAIAARPERWIKISVREDEESVTLKIIDSGPGIKDENIRSRLFQPFFTTKRVGEGTGLGLSITRGILQEHGATIELVDGDNTCFAVTFLQKRGQVG